MLNSAIANLEKRAEADVIVLPFWKAKRAEAAAEIGPFLTKVEIPLQLQDCTGKEEELVWLYGEELEERRILLLGLGERDTITHEKLRRAFGALAKACHKKKIQSLSIVLPDVQFFSPKETAFFAATGLFSANYSFDALKHDSLENTPTRSIERIEWITPEPTLVHQEIQRAYTISRGVDLARDLANGNADDVTPEFLAECARKLAKEYPLIKTEVHDEKWIQEQRMGLFLAVSRASIHSPKCIVVRYRGNPASSDETLLIGKGITFDTGGLNLKPVANMSTMKSDMSGAATVLGVMKALGELSLPVNVTGLIAACENAIGSKSYKPGDVYKAASGKMVEIVDPDAEGRLTLADMLHYGASTLQPSRIIDIATLTGSVVRALGREVAGLWSNSDALAEELFLSGEKSHERVWRMPLYEEYKSRLSSDVADIKNSGGVEGGAIVAALFLQEFVKNVPWAHIDIAGVARQEEAKKYTPKMATGYGVRLLIDFLEKQAAR